MIDEQELLDHIDECERLLRKSKNMIKKYILLRENNLVISEEALDIVSDIEYLLLKKGSLPTMNKFFTIIAYIFIVLLSIPLLPVAIGCYLMFFHDFPDLNIDETPLPFIGYFLILCVLSVAWVYILINFVVPHFASL